MNVASLKVALAAVAGFAIVTVTLAHEDDPKATSVKPRYEGPGYRADVDGAGGAGSGFDGPDQFPSAAILLESWVTIPEFDAFGPNHNGANDCWGYVSPSGREYALLGLSDGLGIVEITEPGNAQIIDVIPGPGSIWRDVKTYQHYAYVVTEASGGDVQVIDLSDVDNGNVTLVDTVGGNGTSSTHNVAIDTVSGYLYRCGGSSNGLRIYSLANPVQPQFVGEWSERYVHDAQIHTFNPGEANEQQIAFCCAGFNGGWANTGLSIVDVTDKSNIQVLAHIEYENNAYSHQCWLSEDGQYIYLNDELNESDYGLTSTTHVFDVSDLNNPVEVGSFTNGVSATTHNLYVKGDLLFAANYSSGLRVFDISSPTAGEEVAFFDTEPQYDSPGYDSLWSNYPYFPSGTIIGSVRDKGLFVWRMLPINQFDFSYPEDRPEFIDPAGDSLLVQIDELDGELDEKSSALFFNDGDGWESTPLVALGGGLFEAQFPETNCGSGVDYYIAAMNTEGATITSPPGAPAQAWSAYAAAETEFVVEDMFETDNGWTTAKLGATSGDWERGVPVNGPFWEYDPISDADGSGQCWLTENEDDNTDVDDGAVRLISPIFDLSDGSMIVEYEYFLRLTIADGFDKMVVEVSSNGEEGPWTEVIRHDTDGGLQWRSAAITQDMFDNAGVELTSTMQFRFTTDDIDEPSINESGLDHFRISRALCTETVPGDLDGDGVVDTSDLLDMLGSWGPCGEPCPPSCDADITGEGGEPDCSVNTSDLLLLLSNWG